MKNELFKDPFVVLMISTRAVTRPESLERLITDEAYLCEQRDRLLNKECPDELIEPFVRIVRDEEWRKKNQLSENIAVSVGCLFMVFKFDKDIWYLFTDEERKVLMDDLQLATKRVNRFVANHTQVNLER